MKAVGVIIAVLIGASLLADGGGDRLRAAAGEEVRGLAGEVMGATGGIVTDGIREGGATVGGIPGAVIAGGIEGWVGSVGSVAGAVGGAVTAPWSFIEDKATTVVCSGEVECRAWCLAHPEHADLCARLLDGQ